jgi:hypothetical protein
MWAFNISEVEFPLKNTKSCLRPSYYWLLSNCKISENNTFPSTSTILYHIFIVLILWNFCESCYYAPKKVLIYFIGLLEW